jgi:hypothetical protein
MIASLAVKLAAIFIISRSGSNSHNWAVILKANTDANGEVHAHACASTFEPDFRAFRVKRAFLGCCKEKSIYRALVWPLMESIGSVDGTADPQGDRERNTKISLTF